MTNKSIIKQNSIFFEYFIAFTLNIRLEEYDLNKTALIASLLIFKPVFVAKTLMIAAVVLLMFSCYKIFVSLKEDSKENEKQ